MNPWDILAIHDTTKTIIMALVQSMFIVLIADAPVAQAFLSAVAAIFAIVVFYYVRAEGYLDHYGISQQQNLKQGMTPPHSSATPISNSTENQILKHQEPTDLFATPENLDEFLEKIEEQPTPEAPLNQSTPLGLTQNAIKPPTDEKQGEPKQEPKQGPSRSSPKEPALIPAAPASNSNAPTTNTPSFQNEGVYAVAPERTPAPKEDSNSVRHSPTQGGNTIPRVDAIGYPEASSIGSDSGIQEADDL